MFAIPLFAIIGAVMSLGAAYWILFGVFCVHVVLRLIANILEKMNQ